MLRFSLWGADHKESAHTTSCRLDSIALELCLVMWRLFLCSCVMFYLWINGAAATQQASSLALEFILSSLVILLWSFKQQNHCWVHTETSSLWWSISEQHILLEVLRWKISECLLYYNAAQWYAHIWAVLTIRLSFVFCICFCYFVFSPLQFRDSLEEMSLWNRIFSVELHANVNDIATFCFVFLQLFFWGGWTCISHPYSQNIHSVRREPVTSLYWFVQVRCLLLPNMHKPCVVQQWNFIIDAHCWKFVTWLSFICYWVTKCILPSQTTGVCLVIQHSCRCCCVMALCPVLLHNNYVSMYFVVASVLTVVSNWTDTLLQLFNSNNQVCSFCCKSDCVDCCLWLSSFSVSAQHTHLEHNAVTFCVKIITVN